MSPAYPTETLPDAAPERRSKRRAASQLSSARAAQTTTSGVCEAAQRAAVLAGKLLLLCFMQGRPCPKPNPSTPLRHLLRRTSRTTTVSRQPLDIVRGQPDSNSPFVAFVFGIGRLDFRHFSVSTMWPANSLAAIVSEFNVKTGYLDEPRGHWQPTFRILLRLTVPGNRAVIAASLRPPLNSDRRLNHTLDIEFPMGICNTNDHALDQRQVWTTSAVFYRRTAHSPRQRLEEPGPVGQRGQTVTGHEPASAEGRAKSRILPGGGRWPWQNR